MSRGEPDDDRVSGDRRFSREQQTAPYYIFSLAPSIMRPTFFQSPTAFRWWLEANHDEAMFYALNRYGE
jgi:hypothetical protein